MTADLDGPSRVVLLRIVVQRLVGAAMVAQVALLVTQDAGRRDPPRSGNRALGDAARRTVRSERSDRSHEDHGEDLRDHGTAAAT